MCLKQKKKWSTEQEMPELSNHGGRLHISLVNAVLAALVCLTVPLDALDADANFVSPASFGLINIAMTDAACSTLSFMRIRSLEFYEAAQEIDREISLDGAPSEFSIPLTDLLPSTSYEASLQFSRNDCVSEPSTISFQLADRGASSAPVPSLGSFSVQRQLVEHSMVSLNEGAGNVGEEAGDGNESHDQSCGDTLPKPDRILFRCAYFCVTVLVALVALVVI